MILPGNKSKSKSNSQEIAKMTLGCLKDMSSEKNRWLRGRQTNWCHAFGIIDWFDDNNDVIEEMMSDLYRGDKTLH